MARFVVESHSRNHPLFIEGEAEDVEPLNPRLSHVEPIEQDVLKKYITYARERVHPKTSLHRPG